jgi:hypothetical protein
MQMEISEAIKKFRESPHSLYLFGRVSEFEGLYNYSTPPVQPVLYNEV